MAVTLAACAAFIVSSACGGGESPTPQATTAPTAAVQQTPQPQSPYQVALASTDLAVGQNRLAFGIIHPESGPLRNAEVQVMTYYLGGGTQEGPKESKSARWRAWPVGNAGVYTTTLNLDRAGQWGLGLNVTVDGETVPAGVGILVKEVGATPAIGATPPDSETRTADDVDNLAQLTSDPNPDPTLYGMTIAEGLIAGKPLVVSFATPAYCQTATCGPQVEVVKDVKETFGEQVNFIHVEVYSNPDEIEGDLSNAKLDPAVGQWGLPSEPWTFVMDAQGLVAAKFEGFATKAEIEDALSDVLGLTRPRTDVNWVTPEPEEAD